MAVIVHLSDLHMADRSAEQQRLIFDALVSVLDQQFASAGLRADLLAITGDIFESATQDRRRATRAFCSLHERLQGALGGAVPTVIIPGNHDRRRRGVLGPHRGELFVALKGALGDRAFVHGTETPFLASVVPREYHGLPACLIAYDSTHLPTGLLSAGGVVRQEDILRAATSIPRDRPDEPVLFLIHHHLVPTPLTDVGTIEVSSATSLLRWAVSRVLPTLISHADREELTMTALGAGTALSTLHELGRAVLVLHGHKHYATARMLRGMIRAQGDVLIVSAGSAGMAEPWSPTSSQDMARLWPSFNVIELNGSELGVSTLSFGYKGRSTGQSTRRLLVNARHNAERWDVEPVPLGPMAAIGPRIAKNHANYRLERSRTNPDRFDYECTRHVVGNGRSPHRYIETIEGVPGSSVITHNDTYSVPARLELQLGAETRYRMVGGVCRTLGETHLVYGATSSPYEWLALMNRYECADATLVVEGLGEAASEAFASVTDLGTGIEQPLGLRREHGCVAVTMTACPARALLRVYWPVER